MQANIVQLEQGALPSRISGSNLRSFVACWLPLVALTILLYRLIMYWEARRKGVNWSWYRVFSRRNGLRQSKSIALAKLINDV